MKNIFTKKLTAFVLSSALLTSGAFGWLPGIKQSGILDSVSITASAETSDGTWTGYYYYTYQNAEFTFRINSNDAIKTACICTVRPVGTASKLPATLRFPATVTAKINGKDVNYSVVELGCTPYNVSGTTVKTVYIPSSVKSLCQSAFWRYTSLSEIKFDSACNIQYAASNSIDSDCPFYKNQMSQKGFVMVGNCLIQHSATSSSALNMSAGKYDAIKYMARNALYNSTNLKTITLPKNLQKSGNYVCASTLETVYYWDSKTSSYRNLKTDVTNSRQSASLCAIMSDCGIIADTKLETQLSDILTRKILSKNGITYRGSVYSGYNAWQQYQIVHKLYTYVGKNYYHYNCNYWYTYNGDPNSKPQSPSYVSEMFQTEVMGYKGEQTKGIKCADYADMFEKLCVSAGIEAQAISTISEDNHAYNVVKIGGKGFNIDCCASWLGQAFTFMTNDDTLTKNLGSHRKIANSPKCEGYWTGDVDGNGKVEVEDAQMILEEYTNVTVANKPSASKLTPLQKVHSDVNRDGEITVEDAQLVLKYYTKHSVAQIDYNSFEDFYNQEFKKKHSNDGWWENYCHRQFLRAEQPYYIIT